MCVIVILSSDLGLLRPISSETTLTLLRMAYAAIRITGKQVFCGKNTQTVILFRALHLWFFSNDLHLLCILQSEQVTGQRRERLANQCHSVSLNYVVSMAS